LRAERQEIAQWAILARSQSAGERDCFEACCEGLL